LIRLTPFDTVKQRIDALKNDVLSQNVKLFYSTEKNTIQEFIEMIPMHKYCFKCCV